MIRYDHYTDKFVKVSDKECPWCKAVCASTDKYCHECGWHIADTPQTDCKTCRHYKLACELFSEVCKYEPTTQTETQNSNLTFEKRTMRDCYNCKRYETEGECIECHYEPKADTPQTDCYMCKWLGEVDVCGRCRNRNLFAVADTPQKKDEIVLDPSFAELSDEQFVKAMKLIEPQTDCGWGEPNE